MDLLGGQIPELHTRLAPGSDVAAGSPEISRSKETQPEGLWPTGKHQRSTQSWPGPQVVEPVAMGASGKLSLAFWWWVGQTACWPRCNVRVELMLGVSYTNMQAYTLNDKSSAWVQRSFF